MAAHDPQGSFKKHIQDARLRRGFADSQILGLGGRCMWKERGCYFFGWIRRFADSRLGGQVHVEREGMLLFRLDSQIPG